jgi:hypothetical protein
MQQWDRPRSAVLAARARSGRGRVVRARAMASLSAVTVSLTAMSNG